MPDPVGQASRLSRTGGRAGKMPATMDRRDACPTEPSRVVVSRCGPINAAEPRARVPRPALCRGGDGW